MIKNWEKNSETWWTREKKTSKHFEKERTMKHDEQDRKPQWKMMNKRKNEKILKIWKKTMKHDEKRT
jgi:hypothetical protein